MSDYPKLRAQAEKFYRKFLSLKVDLSGILIPDKPKTPSRLRFRIEGRTHNMLLFYERKQYEVWTVYTREDDIDTAIIWNAPRPIGSYAFWVRDTIEPEKKYLCRPQLEADPQGIIGVNLYERRLDGFQYFTETGNHLDIKGATICTGSRDIYGSVPNVCWLSGSREVRVDSAHPLFVDSSYGLRSVVFNL